MLHKATIAVVGIDPVGQFAGWRNQVANRSRLETEKVFPARMRLKNAPLLTTIVATRDRDFPPQRATSAS